MTIITLLCKYSQFTYITHQLHYIHMNIITFFFRFFFFLRYKLHQIHNCQFAWIVFGQYSLKWSPFVMGIWKYVFSLTAHIDSIHLNNSIQMCTYPTNNPITKYTFQKHTLLIYNYHTIATQTSMSKRAGFFGQVQNINWIRLMQ